jgi:uncharacterized protein
MFKRKELSILTNRLESEPRSFIQVVLGPRQVGKTTLLRQFVGQTLLPFHMVSADAIQTGNTTWISQQWEVARLKWQNNPAQEVILIIDEIQKISNWSEWVKREWDDDTFHNRNIKVVLLGSSRLLLQQGLTESLAGRYELTYMSHWSFPEMREAFDFSKEQFLWFGGYPGAAQLIADESRWKSYVLDSLIESSISKDILMLTRVDKPALMRNLFEVGCGYSGQILSFTKIMGQLQDAGNTTTLAHYLELLDSACLLAGLEKFSKEVHRQRSSSPKFQVYNTALMSALSGEGFSAIRSQPQLWGRWVESAVGAHLINAALGSQLQVFYWRDRNDEVDFVLTFKEKVIAIEVKSNVSKPEKGLKQFANKHAVHKTYMVGESGLPLEDFLQTNPVDLF